MFLLLVLTLTHSTILIYYPLSFSLLTLTLNSILCCVSCFIYCTQILKILQVLVNCDVAVSGGSGLIGQALVPYYRQILPIFNIFINDNENLGKFYLSLVFIVFCLSGFFGCYLTSYPLSLSFTVFCFVFDVFNLYYVVWL